MNEIYHYVSTRKFQSQKTLLELLIYDGVNCWWFIDWDFHRSGKSYLPGTIEVYTHLYRLLMPPYELITCVFWRLLNTFLGNRLSNKILSKNHRVIFRQQMEEWAFRRHNNGVVFNNVYHRTTIDELYGIDIMSLYEPHYFLNKTEVISYLKILNAGDNIRAFPRISEEYWSWNVWISRRNAVKYFSKIWAEIETEIEWFSGLAELMDMDCDSVKNILKSSLLITLPHAIAKSKIVNNIIHTYHPKSMVMTNGQMTDGRIWVYECSKSGIPTIEIQHGTIANHSSYLCHDSLHVAASKDEFINKFPIPDITCVWGDFDYNLLVNEAGYPASQVIVTGNPRYDYLHHASIKYNRDDFCRRHNINPKSFIVLWATQSHGWSDAENHEYFKEVFETFESEEDVTLVIKQHPLEPEKYTKLINMYQKLYPMKCSILVPNKMEDTTEMVYVSDVLIQKNSTTGQEAVAFHKPLIVLDFTVQPDSGKYVEEGVGFPVFERGLLKEVIYNIMKNGCDCFSAQNEYIRNHMHQLDGNAHKRIANVIMHSIS